MAVVIAEGEVVVKADGSKVARDISQQIDRDSNLFDAPGKKSGGSFMSGFKGFLLGGALVGVAGMIGDVIGQGIQTGISFAMDGINLAGDLAETKNAVAAIFGSDQMGFMETWSNAAMGDMGLTRANALLAAKGMGIMGQSAGLAGSDLFNFSTDLVGLGRDLASFNNTSPEDAFNAIQSALRGESEPLRAFGIMLDDAKVKSKALEMGIWDGEEAFSSQMKTLASSRVIFDEAGVALGDYEATSDSLANQQQTLAQRFEESKTKLGEALLPAMTDLMTFANDELIPVLDDLIADLGPELGDAIKEALPLLLDIIREIVPHIPAMLQFAKDVMPGIAEGAVGLIDGLANIGEGFEGLKGIVDTTSAFINGDLTWDEAKGKLSGFIGQFDPSLQKVFDFGVGVVDAARDAGTNFGYFVRDTGRNVGKVGEFFASIPGRIRSALAGAGSWLYETGRNIIQGLINGVSGMVNRAVRSVTDIGGKMLSGVKSFLGIKSPSIRFEREVGFQMGAGTIRGFEKSMAGFAAKVAPSFDVAGVVRAGAGGVAATSATASPSVSINQTIAYSDPIIAGRQAARAVTERLGV